MGRYNNYFAPRHFPSNANHWTKRIVWREQTINTRIHGYLFWINTYFTWHVNSAMTFTWIYKIREFRDLYSRDPWFVLFLNCLSVFSFYNDYIVGLDRYYVIRIIAYYSISNLLFLYLVHNTFTHLFINLPKPYIL